MRRIIGSKSKFAAYKTDNPMKNLLYLFIMLFLFACQANNESANKASEQNAAAPASNTQDYTLEAVPGTNWQRASKLDAEGNLVETGFFENGKKVGTWVLYEQSKKYFPSQLSTYEDGKLNGIHMEFNEGGMIGLIAYYQDNLLHGTWGKYQFGRVAEEAQYKNGKLDGVYNVYTLATGKLQTSAEYKNGVQDGYYRTYNPEGQVTTEYLYRNGERVSGGVPTSGGQ